MADEAEFQCAKCKTSLIHMVDEDGRTWVESEDETGFSYLCPNCKPEEQTKEDTPVTEETDAPDMSEVKHVERKEFKTMLRVDLTDAEISEMSLETADAFADIETLENQISTHKKQLQSKIDTKKARIAELMGIVRAGYEQRNIACERVFDYDNGVVKEIRLDNYEVIEKRPMEDDEKQMVIPGTEEEPEVIDANEEPEQDEPDRFEEGEED